jgi:hypothetical protein
MVSVVDGSAAGAGSAAGSAVLVDFAGVDLPVIGFFDTDFLGSSASEMRSALRFLPFATADCFLMFLAAVVLIVSSDDSSEAGWVSLGAGFSFSVRR